VTFGARPDYLLDIQKFEGTVGGGSRRARRETKEKSTGLGVKLRVTDWGRGRFKKKTLLETKGKEEFNEGNFRRKVKEKQGNGIAYGDLFQKQVTDVDTLTKKT